MVSVPAPFRTAISAYRNGFRTERRRAKMSGDAMSRLQCAVRRPVLLSVEPGVFPQPPPAVADDSPVRRIPLSPLALFRSHRRGLRPCRREGGRGRDDLHLGLLGLFRLSAVSLLTLGHCSLLVDAHGGAGRRWWQVDPDGSRSLSG